MKKVDGDTAGPDSFSGPQAKAACGDVREGEVVEFQPIRSTLEDLPEEVWRDLSRDQQLLYRFAHAISSGIVPTHLAHQKVGPVFHARWLTLAVRFMQLYVKTPEPSQQLVRIVTYIVQVILILVCV